MNEDRTDQVIQLALALAGQNEDFRERELGPIHVLKYVYLADLAFAERNEGETFTGAKWRFFHFGPWARTVHARIEPAAKAIGAERKEIDWGGESDMIRFKLQDDALVDELSLELPLVVFAAVKKAVRTFANDTYELLGYVYRTHPMTSATPHQHLQFAPTQPSQVENEEEPTTQLTARQLKKRRGKLRELRTEFRKRIAERAAQSTTERVAASPAPRYDKVFSDGQHWLDSLAGSEIEPEGELAFSNEFWESNDRGDPDLS